jgi:hypothetical protein
MIGAGGPCLAFDLPQLRKSTENLSQCSRVVRHQLLPLIGCLFGGSLDLPAPPRLPVGDFSALGRRKCLPSFRNKGFPTTASYESKLSVNALRWSAKSEIA